MKMNSQEIWISVKTLSEIKNVTARAVRLALPKSNYVFREVTSHGGKSYEILLSSLESRVQEIYKNYIMPRCPDRNFLSYYPMQPFVVLHNN